MTVYLTKVWGFTNPCGPLVFSKPGWRDQASEILKPDDLVVLVGTKGEKTKEEEDRGRVLGIMKPSKIKISQTDFPLEYLRDPDLRDEDENFRWPYGLLVTKAWIVEPGLYLDDISSRAGEFRTNSAVGIVPLNDDEAQAILHYPRHEIPVALSPGAISKIEKAGLADDLKGKGAPPPTDGKREFEVSYGDKFADVYCFQLIVNGKIVGHKIGWALDCKVRQKQFNSASLPSLGGIEYRLKFKQKVETASIAYAIEQTILARFEQKRYPHNQEVITGVSKADIEKVWMEVTTEAMAGKIVPVDPPDHDSDELAIQG